MTLTPYLQIIAKGPILGGIAGFTAALRAQTGRMRGRQRGLGEARPFHPAIGQGPQRHAVALVGAGPGCADLMTMRGAQRLGLADIVFYDRLIDPALLDLAPAAAQRVYVGKAPGDHSWPQQKINAALVEAALQGLRVVRLKCGDPGIFARGAEEADALRAAGLTFEIVPGVTAASACAAEVGMFMTERGVVDTLVLTTATGHTEGAEPDWMPHLQRGTRIAIYMGVHSLPKIADQINGSAFASEIEVRIISKLGQPDAKSLVCKGPALPQVIAANRLENPAIIFLTLPKTRMGVEVDGALYAHAEAREHDVCGAGAAEKGAKSPAFGRVKA